MGLGYDLTYNRFSDNNYKLKYFNNYPSIYSSFFYNKDDIPFGFFINCMLAFPKTGNLNIENSLNAVNFDSSVQAGIHFIAVFRNNITEKLTFYYGGGLNLALTYGVLFINNNTNEDNNFYYIDIGGILELGLRYSLNKYYLNLGIKCIINTFKYIKGTSKNFSF